MKSFVLRELLLLSHVERKARRISFDPRLTVVVGANDTGKSSILKTIYWTLGAEPSIVHPTWVSAKVTALARFELDGHPYAMLRQGSFFGLFDERTERHATFSSVTNELGPHLGRLFDFGMTLTSRRGTESTPPPAYLFLPFYVDQDSSWVRPWSGFAKLQQFPRYRQSVAEYHTGLRPNSYYTSKAAVERLQAEVTEKLAEMRALASARERVSSSPEMDHLEISLDSYRIEVDRVLVELAEMQREQESYKAEIIELRNERSLLLSQLGVAEASLREVSDDYLYATRALSEDHVDCPICGATYDNSFAERFAIAKDEDRCRELLVELREDLLRCDQAIEKVTETHDKRASGVGALQALLASRRGTIRLRDVIESQGRQEVQKIFRTDIHALALEIHECEAKIKLLKQRLRSLTDKQRQSAILADYEKFFRGFLRELEVRTLSDQTVKRIAPDINETGSDLPRALLAYYFAILHTINAYSSSTYCPIVIDSPNQQGQDKSSLRRMLSFIFSRAPEDRQMIVGLEDDLGIAYSGKTISLEQKHSLLAKSEYGLVLDHVQPLLDRTLLLSK